MVKRTIIFRAFLVRGNGFVCDIPLSFNSLVAYILPITQHNGTKNDENMNLNSAFKTHQY